MADNKSVSDRFSVCDQIECVCNFPYKASSAHGLRKKLTLLNRRDLEYEYLNVYDEATQLKNRVNCQREKIKRIVVKLRRVTNQQKKMFNAQDCYCICDVGDVDQSERIKELESADKKMSDKLNTLKMHLCSRKQLTIYGRRHSQAIKSNPLSSRSSNHAVHLGEMKTANDRMVRILEERIDTLTKELNIIKFRSEQKTRKLEQELAKLQTKIKNDKVSVQKAVKRKPRSILDKNIQAGSDYLGNTDILIEQLFAERKRAEDLDKQLKEFMQRANQISKEDSNSAETDQDPEKSFDAVNDKLEEETTVDTAEIIDNRQSIFNDDTKSINDFENYKNDSYKQEKNPLKAFVSTMSSKLNTSEVEEAMSDKSIVNELPTISDYRPAESAEGQTNTNSNCKHYTSMKDLEMAQTEKCICGDVKALGMQPFSTEIKCKLLYPQNNILHGKFRCNNFKNNKSWQTRRPKSQDSIRKKQYITMGLQGSLEQRNRTNIKHDQTNQPLSKPRTPVQDCSKIHSNRQREIIYKPTICKTEERCMAENCNNSINRGTGAFTYKTVDGCTMTDINSKDNFRKGTYKTEKSIESFSPKLDNEIKNSNEISTMTEGFKKVTCEDNIKLEYADTIQKDRMVTPNDVKQTLDSIMKDLCTCKKMLKHQTASSLQKYNNSGSANARVFDRNTQVHGNKNKFYTASKKMNIKPVKKDLTKKLLYNSRAVTKNKAQKSPHHDNHDKVSYSVKKHILTTKGFKQKNIHKKILHTVNNGDNIPGSHNIPEEYTLIPSEMSKIKIVSSESKLIFHHDRKEQKPLNIEGQYDPEMFKRQRRSTPNLVILNRDVKQYDNQNLGKQYNTDSADLLKSLVADTDSIEEFHLAFISKEIMNDFENNEDLNIETKYLVDTDQKKSDISLNEKQIISKIFTDEPVVHEKSESNDGINLDQRETITMESSVGENHVRMSSVMLHEMNGKSLKNHKVVKSPITRREFYSSKTQPSNNMKNDSILHFKQKSKISIPVKKPTIIDLSRVIPPKAVLTIRIRKLNLTTKEITKDCFIFLTWQFYDMRMVSTPTKSAQDTSYDFSTTYDITLLPKLVQYMKHNKVCIEVHYTINNHSDMLGTCLLPLCQVIKNPNIWIPIQLEIDSIPRNVSTSRVIVVLNYGHLEVECILHIDIEAIPKLIRLFSASPDEDVDITKQPVISCEKTDNWRTPLRRSTEGIKKRLSFEADRLKQKTEPERRESIGRKQVLKTSRSKSITSTTSTDGNQAIAITIRWLSLQPELIYSSRELVTQIFIDYSFLSHSGEEMETPNSLIRPTTAEERLDYNFRKVFNVDLNVNPMDRALLLHLLEGVKTKPVIEFNAVSEPLEDPLDIETAQDFGRAVLAINDMLQKHPLEDSCVLVLPVTNLNGEKRIGSLSIGVEGLDVMRDLKPKDNSNKQS